MKDDPGSRVFRFGDCVLDVDRGVLERSGSLVPVRAKVFGLLRHLAGNAGRVVGKGELLDAVWPDVTVTEDSLTQAIHDLRRALGDERGALVRTIPRRGYLFAIPTDTPAPTLPGGTMPRVAVLPFRNLTGDADDGILIDGLVEEITNGLARFRTVTIIARHSAFAFRPEDGASPDEIASRLGADFLVEGSARRAGGRFVIAAGLAEARAGRQVWGESFDCAAEELLSLQQVIPRRIIPRLVSNIGDSVLARTAAAPTASLSAFEHFTRGVALLRSYGEGVNARGRDHLLQAVETDPGFAVAQAYLALAEMVTAGFGAPRDVILAAKARAMTAIELAPEEARCHRIMGLVRCQLGEFAAAEQDVRHAVELNPFDAELDGVHVSRPQQPRPCGGGAGMAGPGGRAEPAPPLLLLLRALDRALPARPLRRGGGRPRTPTAPQRAAGNPDGGDARAGGPPGGGRPPSRPGRGAGAGLATPGSHPLL